MRQPRLALYLFFCCLTHGIEAQQMPLFNLIREQNGYNPATLPNNYFVNEQNNNITFSGRHGLFLPVQPQTYVVKGDFMTNERVAKNPSWLFGGLCMLDKLGPTTQSLLQGRFAALFSNDERYKKSGFSIGGNFSYGQAKLDLTSQMFVQTPDVDYSSPLKQQQLQVGAGAFYYFGLKGDASQFYGGLSVQHFINIFHPNLTFRDTKYYYYASFGGYFKNHD